MTRSRLTRRDKLSSSSAIWNLLAAGLGFRGTIAYFLPAGFDEAYYFLYTQHLDWSYFDHPPAVAISTGMGLWLTGQVTPLTMRLGSLTLFTGSLWLMYQTGRQLFGERVGLLSCVITSLTPLFFIGVGTLTAPDNALIFFWSLALYLCSREFFPIDEPASDYIPSSRLTWISLSVGLACLGKYHGFVLGLSLVAFCLTSNRYRRVFASKWLWLGVLVFGLSLFPIIYWNAGHDWISFRFQLGDRFAAYENQPRDRYSISALLGVIAAQIGYLCPSIALPLWWVTFRKLFRKRADRLHKHLSQENIVAEKINLLLWSGLPVAVGFTLVGGITHTFPAWPAPGLWSLSILLAHAASHWPSRAVSKWLKSTGWVLGVLLMFTLTHISLGTLQKPSEYALFGGVVSAQADPSTEMIDAVQLRRRLGESDAFGEAIAHSDFVITEDYWLSGYIAIAMPENIPKATSLPVTSFSIDPRGHAFWFDPAKHVGQNALLMGSTHKPQTEMLGRLSPYFESIKLIDEISTLRGDEPTETFYLYQATNLLKPYPYPY